MLKSYALYIHWPFCDTKCPYCDFFSIVNKDLFHAEKFLKSFALECAFYKNLGITHLHSIFFGGGTPSLMPIQFLEQLFEILHAHFQFEHAEITLESNPHSVTFDFFKQIKQLGVNRISIGVQAFNDKDLKFLKRPHDLKDAISTILDAKKIFDNVSFDLIYGISEQKLSDYEKDIHHALSFEPNHISLYELSIEKGTKFYDLYQKNIIQKINEDDALKFSKRTDEMLYDAGYLRYEISNYAKKSDHFNFQCRHNLTYWNYEDYIGIGVNAHSRLFLNDEKFAFENEKNLEKWMQNPIDENYKKKIHIKDVEYLREFLFMKTRLIDHVIDFNEIPNHIKNFINYEKIKIAKSHDFIDIIDDKNLKIKLTSLGQNVQNSLIKFLAY